MASSWLEKGPKKLAPFCLQKRHHGRWQWGSVRCCDASVLFLVLRNGIETGSFAGDLAIFDPPDGPGMKSCARGSRPCPNPAIPGPNGGISDQILEALLGQKSAVLEPDPGGVGRQSRAPDHWARSQRSPLMPRNSGGTLPRSIGGPQV